MRRFVPVPVFIFIILCCSVLVACQQQSNHVLCSYCGAELLENTKYCSQCGESIPVPVKEQNDSECNITEEQEELINQAINLLTEEWSEISTKDTNNNGHLEIKNTRLIWTDSDEIASALGVEGVEYIVEFILYTDYYGAAPYYCETAYLNNVVFFSDGTSTLATNVVDMYRARTYDSALEMCTYGVVDCGNHFNQVFNLKGPINPKEPVKVESEQKPATNEATDEILPSPSEQNNYTILDSGRCNENIRWEIRSNGTLYIYGNGTVPSYEDREVDGQIAPWMASPLVSEITDVIIGDGISGLGANLFYGLRLKSLYLGRNVRVFDHEFKYFYAQEIYIPKCFKDIYFLLCEASAAIERSEDYPIIVYYEGTEEDWIAQKNSEPSWRNGRSFHDVTICLGYNYNN